MIGTDREREGKNPGNTCCQCDLTMMKAITSDVQGQTNPNTSNSNFKAGLHRIFFLSFFLYLSFCNIIFLLNLYQPKHFYTYKMNSTRTLSYDENWK